MNPEIKEKWIAALRSRKYRQNTERLRSYPDNCFCALGVLCDVLDPKEWDVVDNEDGEARYYLWKLSSSTSLPSDVLSKIGLTGNQHDIIVTLNDEDGESFEKIAKFIELNF